MSTELSNSTLVITANSRLARELRHSYDREQIAAGLVVAFCDHLGFLLQGELEYEINWKSIPIPPDLFIQTFGDHSVKFRQIGIHDHLFPPDEQNALEDRFH